MFDSTGGNGMDSRGIREAILDGRTFDDLSASGACRVRLTAPLDRPLLAVALHASSRMPGEAAANTKASIAARRYEEDPYTDRLLAGLPLTLIALDSRFAYDVNRSPESAVSRTPDQVWGIDLWHAPPSEAQVAAALERYREVHALIDALVGGLVERFGAALVLDCHSYNHRRATPVPGRRSQPLFDVGTRGADRQRWTPVIEDWLARLGRVRVPDIETTVGENEVYDGTGELVRAVRRRHPDALVLPTEVRKSYMDEHTGVPDEPRIEALRRQLGEAALATAAGLLERVRRPEWQRERRE